MVFLISDNLENVINEFNHFTRQKWVTGQHVLLSRRRNLYVLSFRLTKKGKECFRYSTYTFDGQKVLFIQKRPTEEFLLSKFPSFIRDINIQIFLRGLKHVKNN